MTDDWLRATARPVRLAKIDPTVPNVARVWNYLVGGRDNFAADRNAARQLIEVAPVMGAVGPGSRAFLRRAVGYLAADVGVRQFLDIGTGIPTAGNTHHVAQATAPESRVVYVDYDPIVLAHARALLTSSEAGATEYIDADLRDTDTILSRASRLLDFTQPVAVTMLFILHAIPDEDDPHAIVATVLDALPSGSYLALSHLGSDIFDEEAQQGFQNIVGRMSQQQYTGRSREQMLRFFKGMELVEPGLVRIEEWRPDPDSAGDYKSTAWGAVGRKR